MAGRPVDPKDVRVSMVDRGWSESPPEVREPPPPPPLPKDLPPPPPLPGPAASSAPQKKSEEITRDETPEISDLDEVEPSTQTARELPMYEESSNFVTRVDDQMQARANAMTAELEDPSTQATVVAQVLPVAPVAASAPRPAAQAEVSPVSRSSPNATAAAPPPPPPLPRSQPKASPAPAPASSAGAAPASVAPASTKPSRPSSAPPLPRPLVRVSAPPAAASSVPTAPAATKPELAPKVRTAAWPIPQPFVAPVAPAAQASAVPAAQVTPVAQAPVAPVAQAPSAPAAQPPPLPVAKAVSPAAHAPTVPAGSFDSTFPSGPTVVDQLGPVSSLRDALLGRVRVANRPVPLWVVLAPVLVATAMLAALFVGVIGSGSSPSPEAAPATSGATPPDDPTRAAAPTPGGERKPSTLLERAAAGEPTALSTLEQKKPKELGTDEALALSRGKVARDVASAKKLRERLAADPGLAKDKKVIADLLRFAHGRETSEDALAAMAAVPGPLSADLIYEVWTGTAERSEATELARSILLGKDVRPKASPALGVALDLREATTCEESQALLGKAIEVGDKRALVPINRLARKTGCGPNKRQDCYPCLRDGDLVKRSFNAVRVRLEPEILR